MIDGPPEARLDKAVPGAPDVPRQSPPGALPARPLPRRDRWRATAAAAVTLILLTGATACWRTAPDRVDLPVETARPVSTPDTPLTWWMAVVSRSGTQVTVYVSRPLDDPTCPDELAPVPDVTADSTTAVTVAVRNRPDSGSGCSESSRLTAASVTLPAPLGRRALIDGYSGESRPVYREAELPNVPSGPDGWSQVRASTFSGPQNAVGPTGDWYVSFTRPGGPDIRITGAPPGSSSAPEEAPVGTVKVAGVPGRVDASQPDGYQLRWEGASAIYVLTLSPAEGERTSLSEFRSVLRRLRVT